MISLRYESRNWQKVKVIWISFLNLKLMDKISGDRREVTYPRSTDRMEIENKSFDIGRFSLATTNANRYSGL